MEQGSAPEANSNELMFLRRIRLQSEMKPVRLDPPTFIIMVLDRSDDAIRDFRRILRDLDQKGLGLTISKEPRSWIEDPAMGAFLVVVLNRVDKTSAYMGDDDLYDLLSMTPELMRKFHERTTARGRAIWAPMLCEATSQHFLRWIQSNANLGGAVHG